MAEPKNQNPAKPSGGAEKPQKERSWIRLAIFGILLAIGVIWGGPKIIRSFSYQETDNAQIVGDLYPVSPRVPGTVIDVLVDTNQNVRKGDTLLTIDPSDYQIRRDMAEAQLLKAKASVASAQSDIAEAASTEKKLDADLRRSRNLQKQDVISRAELDAVTAGASASTAKHDAAGDKYQAALAQVRLAEAELKNAELMLSWTTIKAPADGQVSRKNVQPGQLVTPGQLLIAIVNRNDLSVSANFKETQLKLMKPGQPVIITVDAFPDKEFKGHVDSISAGTGAQFTLLPPDNASGNFVKVSQRVPVKIVFDTKPDAPLAAGMNVIVEVKVK
ncbi:MAG: HlyD family secretion protein [Chlorobiaceae bacterium]|jgi:membrane fusion protein, multidrug efflux system|nr:HlyD family secretion protein [Chlorobiaceae bacterium]